MKSNEVDRAKVLLDGLRGMPSLRAGNRGWPKRERGLSLQANMKEDYYITHMQLDRRTGNLVLAYVERLIRSELKALGVKVPKRIRGRA